MMEQWSAFSARQSKDSLGSSSSLYGSEMVEAAPVGLVVALDDSWHHLDP